MKITYVQNMRYPTEKAHGYQISKTCEALVKQGADLELFVSDRKTQINQNAFEFYNVEKNFNVTHLHVFDLLGVCPDFLKPFAMWIIQLTYLASFKKTSQREFDIYYTRDPWLAPKIKKLTHKPVFLELHAMPSIKSIKKLHSIDGILCVTKWMESEIKKYLPTLRTIFLPDSVDLSVFDPKMTREQARLKLGIPLQARIVAYGGRFSTMEKGKGLDQLDKAVAEISETIPEATCYMVGGTEQDFEKVEGHNPNPTTRCIKSVDRPTLALYYRAADVLVMPFPNIHHYAFEMSPLKLFEYMASGTVIVTSDLPSVREILNENSAYFYEADNSNKLVESLKAVLLNQDEAKKKADNSKQVVQNFTWQNRAKNILGFVRPI